MPTRDAQLQQFDAALVRLRRLWESPALRRAFVRRLGRPVEATLVRTLKAVGQGNEPGVGDVAEALGIDISTASRLVEQAVADGCVVRGTSPHDRRRSVLALTDAGEDLLARVIAVRTELLREMTHGWSVDDLVTLTTLLERFADALKRIEN